MSTLPPIRQPNRLQHEKSPYLQQHAMNPVDWHPWGNEAIETAEREQKPIFLSIGYSTCHWCHVMERESFEDDSVAEVLNRLFVPVKVDREERPDVDRLYMTAMQALGMGGGWPLNVFLTPALEPFYGGTYFPPRSVPGRIGMLDLLPRVRDAWESARDDVVKQGESIMAAIANIDSDRAETSPGRTALFEGCLEALTRTHDAEWGGFGRAPKFPQVVNLDFLFRWYARDPARNGRALDMALRQLDAMRRGGIHDHVGGGFHRYSTDREWLVPHFEKMLYDQAQLAMAFLDAARLTGRAEYADVARGVLDSVSRDLAAPGGAFASAEDADSEGEEGLFYVWTEAQLAEALPADLAQLVALHYGVTDGGNFEHGASILHEARAIEETATRAGLAPDAVRTRLAEARATLLAARSRRVRPHRDDKVLAAWNGLMIAAFARGARVLDDPALATRAAEAAEFVWTKLRDPATGEMRRRFRDGEVAGAGQLDDYAYMAYGAIELYRATLHPEWLERAVALTEAQIARFWDDERGGFFESPADDPHLKVRLKDEFDGAEIAGNSIALDNLIVLAGLLDSTEWRELARLTADHFERKLARHPIAMPRLLAALMLDEPPRRHVVVAGPRDAADTRALIRAFDARFRPGELLLLVDDASRPRIAALAPFAASLVPQDGRATAYVCVDYACRLPVTDPAAFAAQLDEAVAPLPTGEAR